jgi:hypothetical protein
MKFTFKRKYTLPFMLMLFLVTLCVAFYYVGPQFISQEPSFFKDVLIISIVDSVLLVSFVTGLYRVNYFLYYDHIEIKSSLRKTIVLDYKQIKEVREVKNDKVFLIFGRRPSFKVKYEFRGRIKYYRIRVGTHELFKTVLENEKKIRVITAA